MKKYFSIIIFLLAAPSFIWAQGCVAIRSGGNTCSMDNPGHSKSWQLNFNNRYFKSYKHFIGTIEQKEREQNNTEVINHSYSLDITLSRYFNTRWSMAFTVPFISNSRSSLYEHGGNNGGKNARHSTHSVGVGDMRVTANYWLLNPVTNQKGNIQAGLGFKLPTGDYRYQDYFYKADGSAILGPVDQSLQLGDGGTGFIAELNSFYNFNHHVGLYGNLYYLLNPREQNGVSTARGATPSTTAVQYFTNTMSVPDQYMVRGGVNYTMKKFIFSGGIRTEGIPAEDVTGGNKGFRRPGLVISAEPVIGYHTKKESFYLSVPFAIQRNRTQSYADKLRTAATGNKVHGDAAFSDYFITAGFSFQF